MEPRDPERPGMELLETNSEPGAFERFTTAALQHRWVKVAGVVAVVLAAGVGTWAGLTDDDPDDRASRPEAAPAAPAPRDPSRYEPPPWVTSSDVDWEVLGPLEVNLESPVYVVRFAAVNRSSEARRPTLKAVGLFLGRPGFRFTASCTGFDQEEFGELRPLMGAVRPDERVLMRCTDTMEYSGDRPELDPTTLRIQGLPDDGGGSGPTILYGVPRTEVSDRSGATQEAPLVRGVARLDR